MNEVLLSTEVLIYLLSETLIILLEFFALFFTIDIIKNWDFTSTKPKQYRLEKKSYLVMLIIFFALVVKIALIPYFAYVIDNLSNIIPGAMCAAGVINANDYGIKLLALKIFIVFFNSIWIIINSEDLRQKDYPYIKTKLYFFIFVFLITLIEYILDILYFTNISLDELVLCCTVIFGTQGNSTLPFGLDTSKLIILFYLFYLLTLMANISKQSFLSFIVNILFLYISYLSVVEFFGTYIYELPTHKCPFCMLQKEYYYIGYVLWTTLFLGVFYAISSFVLKSLIKKELDYTYKYSIIFNTIFVSICTLYVFIYYLKNGVFL
ncbi:hypothetical protein CRV00_11220 [Malaciobacter molluscorum]|uniref:hypothetical protein n=1 Tax=Malaciobacter molluscorum TaxID=1032072 RepID=UPI00100BE369|nr:hypothetical protein [Malaciobacter molluscorum]RXJ93491.1 hypothetical protein CRV00_11220 [Malaciobacter molluscorum]